MTEIPLPEGAWFTEISGWHRVRMKTAHEDNHEIGAGITQEEAASNAWKWVSAPRCKCGCPEFDCYCPDDGKPELESRESPCNQEKEAIARLHQVTADLENLFIRMQFALAVRTHKESRSAISKMKSRLREIIDAIDCRPENTIKRSKTNEHTTIRS
jgi:hypothetical protein